MKFRRTPDIEYRPPKQKQIDYQSTDQDLPQQEREETQEKSRADIIAEEFDRTTEFLDFLIDNVDEEIKDVVVEVDPEQHPEVWMAMKRLYGKTAKPFLSGRNYSEALDALDEVNKLEADEAKQDNTNLEDEFINAINQATGYGETPDTPASEMDIGTEDDRAIAEAMEDRRLVVGDEPRKRYTPGWWQRFRRTFTRKKVISIIGGKRTESGFLKQGLKRENRDKSFTRTTDEFRNK